MIKKFIRLITTTVMVLLLTSKISYANDLNAERLDDSCIPMYGFDRLILTLETLGIYYWFSHDFKMIHPLAETNDPNGTCFQPIPDGGKINFVYEPSFFGSFTMAQYVDAIGPGDERNYGGFPLRGQNIGDMLCIQVSAWGQWYKLGCKYRVQPNTPPAKSGNACYIQNVCLDRSIPASKSFLPITAPIVECVTDSVRAFFMGSENCSNMLSVFQQNVTSIVKLMLTLYVIFFGLKVILGKEAPQKGELFLFVIKMSMVMYFSVGITVDGQKYHGVDFIFNTFIGAAQVLSQMALNAGLTANAGGDASQALCLFTGYAPEDQHLQMWDSLDCRIAYYMGLNNAAVTNASIFGTIISIFAWIVAPIMLFYAIVFMIFILLFASVTIYVVQVYLICVIIITIVTFLSPIFVPMVLFTYTKKMFDGWFSLLLANVIQPMVMMMFLGFMFAVMDNVVYPGCKFHIDLGQSANIQAFLSKIGIQRSGSFQFWSIDFSQGSTDEQTQCAQSLGGFVQQFGTAQYQNIDIGATLGNILLSMLQVIMFMFLFFFLTQLVSALAADLSGGPASAGEMAGSATAVFNKGVDLASKGAKKVGASIKESNKTNKTARK